MKGRCRITFVGLNADSFVCKLAENKIPILRFVKIDVKTCAIDLFVRNEEQVIALLQEKCYNIVKRENLGLQRIADFCKKHAVVVVCIALCFAFCTVSSHLCLRVEVDGADEKAVGKLLGDCGIGRLAWLGENFDSAENYLACNLDASYCLIEKVGSTLFVKVVPLQNVDDVIDLTQSRDLIAEKSGVVTKITVVYGTAVVSVGDRVEAGQVLISGKRTFSDGTSQSVRAVGEVIATVSVSAFCQYQPTVAVKEYSGRQQTVNVVEIFGKEYHRSFTFDNYDLEQTEVKVGWLTLKRQTATEYLWQTVDVTFEQSLDEMKKTALQRATEKADFTVQKVEYSVTAEGVTATVFGNVRIGGDENILGGKQK